MNVLAFAASSSKQSINKQLVSYACSLLKDDEIEILDLNNYELPLFSVDREKELGQPSLANEFFNKIGNSDAVIISFAEHNGAYSAAYKNLFDWCSRINPKVFQNKPMILLATSPGGRGGASVLAAASNSAPFFAGKVKATLAIPNFFDNFDVELQKLTNQELNEELKVAINSLK